MASDIRFASEREVFSDDPMILLAKVFGHMIFDLKETFSILIPDLVARKIIASSN